MAKYRVCGTRGVLGHLPGEQFEADISDMQEQRLVKGGHIERMVPGDASLSDFRAHPPDVVTPDVTPEPSEELPDDRAGEPEQEKE